MMLKIVVIIPNSLKNLHIMKYYTNVKAGETLAYLSFSIVKKEKKVLWDCHQMAAKKKEYEICKKRVVVKIESNFLLLIFF